MRPSLLTAVPLVVYPIIGYTQGIPANDNVVRLAPMEIVDSRTAGPFAASTSTAASPGAQASGPLSEIDGLANTHFASSGQSTFGSVVSVRGLSNTPYFGEAALAWYIDDLPLATVAATPALVPGADAVDWTRGPQAAFSLGRYGTAGAAIVRTLATGGCQQQVRVGYGSRNTLDAEARATAKAGEVDVSAALAYFRQDGWVTNTTLGQTVGDVDHRAANARVRWTPAKTFSLSLQAIASQARDGAQPLVPLSAGGRRVQRPQEGQLDADFGGAVLSARAVGNYGALSSHTSAVDWKLSPYQNALQIPVLLTSLLTQKQRTFSEEVRWMAPATLEYPMTAGLWWSDHTTEGTALRKLFGSVPIEDSYFKLHRRTLAAYAQSVLMSDEGWSLDGALRVERQTLDFGRTQAAPSPDGWRRERSSTRLTPKFTLTIPVAERSRLLASASEAYKPEGYSAYTDNENLSGFRAERTRAYEIWWEWMPFENLKVNTRAFRYDIRNYQIERSFTETDYLVVNAPRARSQGLEVECDAKLTETVSLRFSTGWQQVKLTRFTDPFTGLVHDGSRAPFAPRFTGRFAIDWSLAPGLLFSIEARRTGTIYYTESEDKTYLENRYTLISAALRYERGRWAVAARVRNATDESYRTIIVPGIDHAVPGEPRTWVIDVTYRW